MARYRVVLMVEGSRIGTIEKEAQKAFGAALQRVQKVDLSRSRADRLADIQGALSDAANDVEELRGEIEEWKESIPENLQGGDKYAELEECEQALEELKDNIEGIECGDISFPSMM